MSDELRADLEGRLSRESDHELLHEYDVAVSTLSIEGVIDTMMIDIYGEVLDLIKEEMCKRFYGRVVACQA